MESIVNIPTGNIHMHIFVYVDRYVTWIAYWLKSSEYLCSNLHLSYIYKIIEQLSHYTKAYCLNHKYYDHKQWKKREENMPRCQFTRLFHIKYFEHINSSKQQHNIAYEPFLIIFFVFFFLFELWIFHMAIHEILPYLAYIVILHIRCYSNV